MPDPRWADNDFFVLPLPTWSPRTFSGCYSLTLSLFVVDGDPTSDRPFSPAALYRIFNGSRHQPIDTKQQQQKTSWNEQIDEFDGNTDSK